MAERVRHRRALAAGQDFEETLPVWDLNVDRVRRYVLVFLGASVLNVAILAVATYKGVEVMESVSFCGTTCHTVMNPEYTTYQRSPHARVACVECHIGSGADWFVKSKLSGTWQVISVAFDLYERPIPVPVHNLRPARETCEQCHWPSKFVGDRLKVITHYDDDVANTEKKTVLLLRVGGVHGRDAARESTGTWTPTRDPLPARREAGDDLRGRAGGRTARDAVRRPAAPRRSAAAAWRIMDCIDCHNRPSHVYRLARDELDAAIREGSIDPALPLRPARGPEPARASLREPRRAPGRDPRRPPVVLPASTPTPSRPSARTVQAAGKALATSTAGTSSPT